jgi:hypothetical protein
MPVIKSLFNIPVKTKKQKLSLGSLSTAATDP